MLPFGGGIHGWTTSADRYMLGTETLLNNLNKEIKNIEGRISKRGMITSLLLLKRDSMKMTPVRTGNLRASYSTFVYEGFYGIEGYLVNNASYALFVHEMAFHTRQGVYVNWSKKGTGPKFVERALRNNYKRVLQILADTARIK